MQIGSFGIAYVPGGIPFGRLHLILSTFSEAPGVFFLVFFDNGYLYKRPATGFSLGNRPTWWRSLLLRT